VLIGSFSVAEYGDRTEDDWENEKSTILDKLDNEEEELQALIELFNDQVCTVPSRNMGAYNVSGAATGNRAQRHR
jgi:hypothetical protein